MAPLTISGGGHGRGGRARDAGVHASAAGGGSAAAAAPSSAAAAGAAASRTTRPMVTGSSVLGVRCVDGVVLAADTLASYGSLARFRALPRLHAVVDGCVVGIGGDLSDQQEILTTLEKLTTEQLCLDDGYRHGPRAMYSYLSRVMYNRRNKMDPLWNHVVFAGFEHGAPMMGIVDLHGGHFESEVIATGYGLHMGLPLLRKAWRPDLTVEEAVPILEDIMKVLYYRDARTIDRIQTAVVTKDLTRVSEPKTLETKWDYKAFVAGAHVGGDVSTW